MAFGLDDLANFVEGLRRTFKGSSEPTRVQQNIQQGVVDPLRMGAELSGVNQAYRGSSPDASSMDRGLALLAMAGMLGGQQAAQGVKAVIQPKYAYGLHISPTGGLKQIKSDAELSRWMDNVAGNNYFFDTKELNPKAIREMEKYLALYVNKKGPHNLSVYNVRTHLRGVHVDTNINPFELSNKPQFPKKFEDAIEAWSGKNDKSIFDFAAIDRRARHTQNPLEVLAEYKIGRNAPKIDGYDDFVPAREMWSREDFADVLKKINKSQPRKSRENIKWIENVEKEYMDWKNKLPSEIKEEFRAMKRMELSQKIKKTPIYKNKKATP